MPGGARVLFCATCMCMCGWVRVVFQLLGQHLYVCGVLQSTYSECCGVLLGECCAVYALCTCVYMCVYVCVCVCLCSIPAAG